MTIEPDRVYTLDEVAELLRCSRANVHRLALKGQLASVRIGAGNAGYRVLGRDLLAFLESRRSGGPQPNGAIKHLERWVSRSSP
jgi:excisionase family DNA binding protein